MFIAYVAADLNNIKIITAFISLTVTETNIYLSIGSMMRPKIKEKGSLIFSTWLNVINFRLS